MHYIFIVNDIQILETYVKADKIVDYLLSQNRWIGTPRTTKVKKGDKVLVYIAGYKRRYFYRHFEIAGDTEKNQVIGNSATGKFINKLYTVKVPIYNISKFNNPIFLDKELRMSLDFITNKQHWGLFFRQAIKGINEHDYAEILKRGQLLPLE